MKPSVPPKGIWAVGIVAAGLSAGDRISVSPLRAVVVGHFLEGRSHRELGRHLGLGDRTVGYRITKGIERLRRELAARGIKSVAAEGFEAPGVVVSYTDSDGSQDYNQILSERRAGRVTNYLQQQCGWKPWRMLTPTGMSESDPAADNSTPEGKAQNRRVSVNILVSKATEEG